MYKSKLKNKIKELIPGSNGKVMLAESVETSVEVYNYCYKQNIIQKAEITNVEIINGRFYVSDGFNDFPVNELSEDDANKILNQL